MRGGFLHNFLVDRAEEHLLSLGAVVYREYPTNPGTRDSRFIDLCAMTGGARIAIEAELSTDRIAADVGKALTVEASLLLILVPDSRIAARIQRQLDRTNDAHRLPVCVLPLGRALQRLTRRFEFCSGVNVNTEDNKEPSQGKGRRQ
jgi:hypothetical protein